MTDDNDTESSNEDDEKSGKLGRIIDMVLEVLGLI